MKSRIEELFLDKDYNCAESTLIYANEKYDLGLSTDDIRLISAFGGGLCSGLSCGALSGSVSCIGKTIVNERAHATEGFKEKINEYVKAFRKEFGSTSCRRLKTAYFKEDVRCLELVEKNAELLDRFMKEL